MKRIALVVAGLALAIALSGCGFSPLYATAGSGGQLASIDIHDPLDDAFNGRVKDRTGFLLKQSLTDELAIRPGAMRYALDTTITERRYPRGVRVNNVANRYEINMTVAYTLTENASGKVVAKGSAPVIVDYDSADPPYAGTVAARDGDQRAVEQAAIQIRLALGRYFAGRPLGAPAITETPVPQNPNSGDPLSN